MNNKVWFISGTTTGFGKALTLELLDQGYKVVATARDLNKLDYLPDNENLLKVKLDVQDESLIKESVSKAIDTFGRIDVLVNNAGYGYFGAMEESDQAIVRDMMETNFWGAANLTLAILPYMRAQKSGHIFSITSRGGLNTFPALSYYHATKFAMEGLFQSLAQEVVDFNIKVTNIEPGGFRTDWAGRSKTSVAIEDQIPGYDTAHKFQEFFDNRDGQQPGSPALAAKAFIKLSNLDNPPIHFLMGADAYEAVRQTYVDTIKEFDEYKEDSSHLSFGDEDYWTK